MHEESLVQSLLRQVAEIGKQHQATAITEIEVEIGPLSGVEALLVASAFERVSPGTPCETATLTIRKIPIRAACDSCGANFSMAEPRFCCSECRATNIRILRGDEFRLMNVTLETSDELPPSTGNT